MIIRISIENGLLCPELDFQRFMTSQHVEEAAKSYKLFYGMKDTEKFVYYGGTLWMETRDNSMTLLWTGDRGQLGW